MKLKRLPDTELEVLKALWSAGKNVPRVELETRLRDKGWASNTVNTYLARLTEKGFITCRKQGKSNVYTPLVSQKAYQAFESRSLLEKLYGSSIKNFVASFVWSEGIQEDEIQALQSLLDELKERRGPNG